MINLKERQNRILNAIKNNGNYCSKCDFTWVPFSEYTEEYCPKCEKEKIKEAKAITRQTLNFIENNDFDSDGYDLNDDFTLNIGSKPWLNEE